MTPDLGRGSLRVGVPCEAMGNVRQPIPTFWTEAQPHLVLYLRRYAGGAGDEHHYHDARAYVGSVEYPVNAHELDPDVRHGMIPTPEDYDGDERWPATCDRCSYTFVDEDRWQVFTERLFLRPDTGETWAQRDLPHGAMHDAPWMPDRGPDGVALVVILPPCGHAWHVDGPAHPPEGDPKPHAWSRTGDPTSVPPTVDVSPSIEAGFSRDGAGKWLAKGPCYYHGHLKRGVLTAG